MNLVNMEIKYCFMCFSLGVCKFLRQGGLPLTLCVLIWFFSKIRRLLFMVKAVLGKILKVTTGWNNEVYVTQVNKDSYWTLSVPTPAGRALYVDIYGW